MPLRRLSPTFCGAVVLCYFVWNAGPGLIAPFTQDDLMNLHGCWQKPVAELVESCILFFSPAYRPLGGLFYRGVFHFAGLHPLPFHAVCFAILVFNLWLLFAFARRISGSVEIASLTVLLGCFHVYMADLYFSSGTIYDLLCFAFFFGTLLYYFHVRKDGEFPGTGQTLVLLALFILGTDSKEVVLVLPVLILLWELLYHAPSLSQEAIRSWICNHARTAIALGAAGLLSFLRTSSEPTMASNAAYQLTVTSDRYLSSLGVYLGRLLFLDTQLPAWFVLVGIAFLLCAPLLLRSRLLLFAAALFLAGELPVAFVPPRGLFALYIPLAGLQLFVAVLIVRAKDFLLRPWPLFRAAAPMLSIPFLAVLLTWQNGLHRDRLMDWNKVPSERIHSMIGQTAAIPIRRGASVMLLNDPFDENEWTPVFILRLTHGDRNMVVFREKTAASPVNAKSIDGFDYLFRFEGGKLALVRGPG